MTHDIHLDETRAAYDTVAADYAVQLRDQLEHKPTDREILATFARETIGPVLDVGCGPGHVTHHLHQLGLDISGLDLSPAMVSTARALYPHIRFEEGSMLDIAQRELGGVVAWYSIIHTEPDQLPALFDAFHDALRPGGSLVLAFQVGDERRHIEHGYGHVVSLDAWRLPPERITQLLAEAGFSHIESTVRDPDSTESVPQAYVRATR